ncbi:MAG: hypothetical protein KJZ83_14920 [Burkholderiaceae bacterium]|nr:hypothetical protein [Burkholderiaceae bacterium]
MRVRINLRGHEFAHDARLIDAVRIVRAATADDPMLRAVRERTGGDHISYLVNGRLVPESEYESLGLREDDDIRWIHPAFGG